MRETLYQNKEREKKILIAPTFSIIMISSAITIYENTSTVTNNPQQSIPIQSYNAYGESVSFIGSQPVISFSPNPLATHYPVSWQILSVNTGGIHNTNSATPFISSNNTPLSLNHFTHYTTSRINDTTQNSAQLIQYSNTTQSASVFFFHRYTMSSSLAWKNKHPYNQTYMIDFTMITPYTNIYHVGGNGFHNMIMNNNTGFIPASCVNLQVGGIDINWCSDISLFHGGMIEQKDHHDIVVIPFGTVTLQSNETYTIDPSMEPLPQLGHGPIRKPGGGGTGGGGGGSGSGGGSGTGSGGGGGSPPPVTNYPPTFSTLNVNNYPNCMENNKTSGTYSDKITFNYEVSSKTQDGGIKLKFYEIQTDGAAVPLKGTVCAYQDQQGSKTFIVNNTGYFNGFSVSYYNPNTGSWACACYEPTGQEFILGHPFQEFVNTDVGLALPTAQFNSGKYIIKDNGIVIASMSGSVEPSSFLKAGHRGAFHINEGVFSNKGTYIPQKRYWSLKYVGDSLSGLTDQVVSFSDDKYCNPHSNKNGYDQILIAGTLMVAAAILGISTMGGTDVVAYALGLGAWAVTNIKIYPSSAASCTNNEISCSKSGECCRQFVGHSFLVRYGGFNGTANPYYYFQELPKQCFCANGFQNVGHNIYFLTKYDFTESFSVFKSSADSYSRYDLPHLYSSSAVSSVFFRTYKQG